MTLYLKHFGMREAPFKITPTTEFFYGGGRRGEILYALQYAIEVGEGIMMVTGEVGSGKTMLLRTLEQKLPPNIELVYIANPSLSGREILYNICEELELNIDTDRPDTVRLLQNYLIQQHAAGKRVVAFIDEAQAMPDESLEEIRLLSNLETSRHKLLQIAMFGQPELLDKLSQHSMRQLRERITVALNLEPFNRDDIREYISTRLHAAGYNGSELFAKDGCQLLAAVSQGLSRRINVLADKSLLSAFERSSDKVLYEDVRRAVKDANFGRMRYRSEQTRRVSRQLTVGLTLAACLVLAVAILNRGDSTPTTESTETVVAISQNSDKAVVDESQQTQQVQESQEAQDNTAEVVAEVSPPTAGEELQAVINSLEGGESVDTNDIARELSQVAESHEEYREPPAKRQTEEWESKIIRDAGLEDNERWGWMPESSYLRLRLNATQTWLQTNGNEGWTARLLTVGQDRGVFLEKFLRHFAEFYPLRNLMVYPLRLGDKDRFVVTFGVYRSRQDADVYIDNMPRYFVGGRPFAQQMVASVKESNGNW